MILVLGGGAIIMGIATVVLVLAFRSFGTTKPRLGLIGGLVAFVFFCCVLLFALSYAGQR
jgi:hypothetical protein